jgi:hypothetical protein
MCARVGQRGRYATPYSSYGSGPDGTRGLYLLGEAMGARSARITRDLAALPPGATLLALGGCGRPPRRAVRRYEAEALEAWVERGGVLVVAGVSEYLPDALGVSLEGDPAACEGSVFDALDQSGAAENDGAPTSEAVDPLVSGGEAGALRWAAAVGEPVIGLDPVPMVAPARIALDEGVAHELLFEIDGAPAGVIVPRGRGAVVALASATPFQNEWLEAAGGGVLLFRLRDRLAPEAPLLFDEYHLGVGASRSIVQYLRALGAGPAIVQLALAAALLLFRLGARLGVPREEPPPRAGGAEAYVEALGGLYARTRDRAGVLAVLRRGALERIARAHRARGREPAAILEEVGTRLPERARAAVLALGADGAPPANDRALVEGAKAIDALASGALVDRVADEVEEGAESR